MAKIHEGMYVIDDSTSESLLLGPPGFGKGLDLSGRGAGGFAYGAAADPFPASLVIPRSEWQARIEERKAKGLTLRNLCDKAKLPPMNQAQTNYCTDVDTEVLTEGGWVRWPDYNGTDPLGTMNRATGILEFQVPSATQVLDHDGPMIYSTNRNADFAVTPNHRMLVRTWDESRRALADTYTFREAGKLGWYFGLPPSTAGFVGTELVRVAIPGDREYSGDDFVALVSLVVSDGYAGGTEKTRNWVSFCCLGDRPERQRMARDLAARTGFCECPSNPGVFVRYDAGALAGWFRANAYTSPELGAAHKRVPGLIMHVSSRQVRHFLDCYGDASVHKVHGTTSYFSVSKRCADDIQELLLRVGQRGSVRRSGRAGKRAVMSDGQVVTSQHDMFCVNAWNKDTLSIDRNAQLVTDRYRGPVYCATVPNSTLVTRRNGTILISGNCWVNAPTYCMEVVRVIQNEPQVLLSPASAGAQIKNYQNVGGWGREALQWISDKGLVPVTSWPANAIDRQYATDANIKLALDYRATEWWELEAGTIDQLVSCLLRSNPVAVGLSWWSHEVTYVDADWVDGAIACVFRNSWGTSYGDNGYGVLQGQRMIPDDAVSPRVAVAS